MCACAVDYLRPAADLASDGSRGVRLELIVRERGDTNKPNIDRLLDVVRGLTALGTLSTDYVTGSAFAESFKTEAVATAPATVDATPGLEAFFSIKDARAIEQVVQAGHLTARLARNVFVQRMVDVIQDEEAGVTNASLSEKVRRTCL
ncbi:hypothetical protein EON67_02165 [archaeon]|nr:MAG: hypothetical protein EON67_02165 [archaeon]